MTDEELEKLKNHPLFKESCSIAKDYQGVEFTSKGTLITGKKEKVETVGNEQVLVIYNFEDGLIHDEGNVAAIIAPSHQEFWDHGMLKKIIDYNLDLIEYWENGLPVRIEKNISERLNNGELFS